MTPEDQLSELLDRWQEITGNGGRITARELCRDHPKLLPELSRQIEVLKKFQAMMPESGSGDTPTPSSADVLPAGTEIDGYRLVGRLGDGGMGIVYRALSPNARDEVALKIMRPEVAADFTARVRFLREAKSLTDLRHPNIVTLLKVGQFNSVPYLVMELLRGESLATRIKKAGKLPSPAVRRVGLDLAAGLAAAHKRQLIHRDIKPGNIWIDLQTGRAIILDFGLVRLKTAGGDKLTGTAEVVGTPAFMAPEQATGKPVDHRCDLFSLGAVLYEAATGERPFRGKNTMDTLRLVVNHHPPAPAGLDGNLAAILMALLSKKPDDRPATADDLVELFEGRRQLPELLPPEPATENSPGSSRTPSRRRVLLLTAATLAVAALIWLVFR